MQTSGIFLSILFGFVPMLAFAYVVYWTDRYEKEPLPLLIGLFLWGAIVAAGAAFLVNSIIGLGVYLFTGSQAFTELSTSSAIAPVIEETLKGLSILLVFLFFRREFDSILDGIVFASITALGFAATENVYYLYTYGFLENGLSGVLYMFFVRVILVGWQHPFYTSFAGIGLAVSRLNRNPLVKFIAPIIGWGIAVITHSFHNTLSTLFQGSTGLVVGMILDWSGWVAMIIFIIWALYREQRWIIAQLKDEANDGVITPAQYKVATSAWSQTNARLLALFTRKYRLVNRFYLLTAELAFKKEHSSSSDRYEQNSTEIEKLRSELAMLSPHISA